MATQVFMCHCKTLHPTAPLPALTSVRKYKLGPVSSSQHVVQRLHLRCCFQTVSFDEVEISATQYTVCPEVIESKVPPKVVFLAKHCDHPRVCIGTQMEDKDCHPLTFFSDSVCILIAALLTTSYTLLSYKSLFLFSSGQMLSHFARSDFVTRVKNERKDILWFVRSLLLHKKIETEKEMFPLIPLYNIISFC